MRLSGAALRFLGRLGDLAGRLTGRTPALTHEAALVLTQCVPLDDAPTVAALGVAPTPIEESLRDFLAWLHAAGILSAAQVGKIAAAPSQAA